MFKISIHLRQSRPEKLNRRRNGKKKKSTLCLYGLISTLCLNGLTLTDSFQNPQILRTISSGHDIIHTPALFPVWGFIMTMVIVISFAVEHKTTPNDYAPELRAEELKSQPNGMIRYNLRKMIDIKNHSLIK